MGYRGDYDVPNMPLTPGGKPKKFKYTYQDIATICGLSVKTIRNNVAKGILNPYDFGSIIDFILKHTPKQ